MLADEIATELGTAGHLRQLRRLRSGPFVLEHAVTLPQLSQQVAGTRAWRAALRPARGADRIPWRPRSEVLGELLPAVVPMSRALAHLPSVEVQARSRSQLLQGGPPPPPPPEVGEGERYLALEKGEVLAVVERRGSMGITQRVNRGHGAAGS